MYDKKTIYVSEHEESESTNKKHSEKMKCSRKVKHTRIYR